MTRARSWLGAGLFLLFSPAALAGADYVGVLKPSSRMIAIPESALQLPFAGSFGGGSGVGTGLDSPQIRFGYRPSRNWSLEAGYADSDWVAARIPYARPGAGQRYGLGLKYDLTRSFGVKADMEHYSPFNRRGLREPESDQLTFGVFWRF